MSGLASQRGRGLHVPAHRRGLTRPACFRYYRSSAPFGWGFERAKEHTLPTLPYKYRNLLRGASDPFAAVSRVRQLVDSTLYDALVAWLPNVRYKGRGVVEGRFPPDVRFLKRARRVLAPIPLEKELLWSASILRGHAVRLREFRTRAQDFEDKLLHSGFEAAWMVLDDIERTLGTSLAGRGSSS